MFQLGKARTRDGKEARIICVDGPNELYPLVAFVTDPNGTQYLRLYTREGRCFIGAPEDENDLVSAREIFRSPHCKWRLDDARAVAPYGGLSDEEGNFVPWKFLVGKNTKLTIEVIP